MSRTWPFTARDGELTTASAALTERGAVVIGGPAGVGKSRLARELAERVGAAGTLGIVRATASAQEIPLGAFVGVLPEVGRTGHASDLIDIRDAVQTLVRDGTSRLLVVDDAHLLDDVSAALLHQLVAARRGRVVLTLRTGEPAPDAVTALWKEESAARIELAPFDRDQTATVLTAVLGGALEARSARLLHDTTRGNVLWLRHLVDGERAAGRLRAEAGVWSWTGEVTLSPALEDLLAARIGTLDDAGRRVLELLAMSEPLGLGMLERLAGASAVEDVAQRGLVTVEPDGERWNVRFGHPLYSEAVRARTSVPRQRRLRSELSTALAGTGGRRAGDGLRRAVLDLGSDRPLDPEELVAASRQASALQDLALAERLLRAAVAAGGGYSAKMALAFLLDYRMRVDEADILNVEALADATTDAERERGVLLRALSYHFQLDPPRSGEDILAEDEAQHHQGRRNPAYDGLRAMILASRGRVQDAAEVAERVLSEDHAWPDQIAMAVFALALSRALLGHSGSMGAMIDRGVAAADVSVTGAAAVNIGYLDLLDADLQGRPEIARRRLDWVRGLSGPQAPVFTALYEGRVAISAGLPRTAINALESCLPSFPGHGGGWSTWSLALIAQCHGMLGDARAASSALAEAEQRRHRHIPVIDFEYDLARAWAVAADGSNREAIGRCRQAADRCHGLGIHAPEVLLRQTSVRFGDREQADHLADLDRLLDTPRSALAAAHAAALAAEDPERLLEVAARLEEAGMGLEAADAAGQAAAVARGGGRTVLATEAEGRARALSVPTDARTPAVLEAETEVPLSAREREIAILAGQGLTNRQIAAQLHVSVRTVESHVYRACSRLGLADRTALIAAVGKNRRT